VKPVKAETVGGTVHETVTATAEKATSSSFLVVLIKSVVPNAEKATDLSKKYEISQLGDELLSSFPSSEPSLLK
jgi:hypothetical protein